MRRLAFFLFVFISFFSVIVAQSGRKVDAVPAPTPVVEAALNYSESTPLKKRPRYQAPSLRGNSGIAADKPTLLPNAKPAAAEGDDIVKVETNLVTIPVSVFDKNGLYIPNLRQADFKIFEDGKEQEISYFGSPEKPFTVVLLIDVSPSTAYQIDEIHAAASAFVNQLKPQDQVMVIEFDRKVDVLTEPTGDRQKIYKAIKKADFGNGTSIYDAVDISLAKHLSKITGRKAIVLFTDGVDTASKKATFDSSLNLAEESDSLIFPIYYNTFQDIVAEQQADLPPPVLGSGETAAEYALGKNYLDELASYTGGRVFRPESTPGGLTAAFEGIAEELRRQYSIGYVPSEDSMPGQRKQIKVRVNRPNLILRARDSYIVGANEAKPAVQPSQPR